MQPFNEGELQFQFEDSQRILLYDKWDFYQSISQKITNTKGVDFACLDGNTVYLIEVKDFYIHPRCKKIPLTDEIAMKVRDTLAGLFIASKYQPLTESDSEFIQSVIERNTHIRLVFHLELSSSLNREQRLSRLANYRDKLRKILSDIDLNLEVTEIATPNNLPWTVVRRPNNETVETNS